LGPYDDRFQGSRARRAGHNTDPICNGPHFFAHGVVGSRFFPATIATDDPFVADELSLPTVSHQKTSTDPSIKQTDITTEYSKSITPDIGFSFGAGWTHLDQSGPPRNPNGWQNIELGLRWQFLRNAPHEAVASIALTTELGGTGARRVGADPFATYTPTFLFGKGAGDLPDTMGWLRPLALTGTIGYAITSEKKTRTFGIDADTGETTADVEHHSNRVEYGFALEYSMLYLRSQVRDLGLPEWVNRLTPLVEFSFSTPTTSRFGEQTVGTINPGIIWSGQRVQFGIEAIIPATRASGKNIGVIAQVHFYLDDIFPQSLGRPLFGD
jgi:hypothetical protein